jgi:hypothetical protein
VCSRTRRSQVPKVGVDRGAGGRWPLALVVGHCPQRLPCPPLRVADRGVAFTERGQHRDRQTFEPAFPVGTFLAQYRLGN